MGSLQQTGVPTFGGVSFGEGAPPPDFSGRINQNVNDLLVQILQGNPNGPAPGSPQAEQLARIAATPGSAIVNNGGIFSAAPGMPGANRGFSAAMQGNDPATGNPLAGAPNPNRETRTSGPYVAVAPAIAPAVLSGIAPGGLSDTAPYPRPNQDIEDQIAYGQEQANAGNVPSFSRGGTTSARKFVVGDSPDGLPNEEVIENPTGAKLKVTSPRLSLVEQQLGIKLPPPGGSHRREATGLDHSTLQFYKRIARQERRRAFDGLFLEGTEYFDWPGDLGIYEKGKEIRKRMEDAGASAQEIERVVGRNNDFRFALPITEDEEFDEYIRERRGHRELEDSGELPHFAFGTDSALQPANASTAINPLTQSGDQPFLDRIRAIRTGISNPAPVPGGGFNVGFQNVLPSLRERFIKGQQSRFGVPIADQLAEINRFRLPTIDRNQVNFSI
jgi:hypothetical protein